MRWKRGFRRTGRARRRIEGGLPSRRRAAPCADARPAPYERPKEERGETVTRWQVRARGPENIDIAARRVTAARPSPDRPPPRAARPRPPPRTRGARGHRARNEGCRRGARPQRHRRRRGPCGSARRPLPPTRRRRARRTSAACDCDHAVNGRRPTVVDAGDDPCRCETRGTVGNALRSSPRRTPMYRAWGSVAFDRAQRAPLYAIEASSAARPSTIREDHYEAAANVATFEPG